MTERTHRWGRPSAPAERGYGTAYRRMRRRLLREEPDCRLCAEKGKKTKATFCDHIKPKCFGGSDHPDNLQPLCRDCSLSKTGREGAAVRNAKRRRRQQQ